MKTGLIYFWAVLGVVLLIGQALWRLMPFAWEAVSGSLSTFQWSVCIGWVVVNAYSEGYKGFHKKFSPKVTRRAMNLAKGPSWLRVVFAAPYSMGLFAADRRTKTVGWAVVLLIVAAILLVRRLDQPWRGIIDAGVVVGLVLGLLSLFVHAASVWSKRASEDRK